MRTIISCISLLLIASSCGFFRSKDQGASTDPTLRDVQARAAVYAGLLGNPYQLGIARCDNLTHIGHYDAANPTFDIYKHEYDIVNGAKVYKTGQWHRDVEPCNTNPGAVGPVMDSKSECSKEGVLAAFHNMLSRKDTDGILRTIRRARDHDWKFCEGGDDSYNRMVEFAPLMNDWSAKLTSRLTLAQESDAVAIPRLEGFRGNVLNSYILLKGRAFGYINTAEKAALESLIATVPESPLYRAVYHRFTDGNQSTALDMLTQPFWTTDRLPDCKVGDTTMFQWEGSHCAMLYVWSVGILSGL